MTEERPGATQGKKTLWVVIQMGEASTFEEIEGGLKRWVRQHRDMDLKVTRIQRGRS